MITRQSRSREPKTHRKWDQQGNKMPGSGTENQNLGRDRELKIKIWKEKGSQERESLKMGTGNTQLVPLLCLLFWLYLLIAPLLFHLLLTSVTSPCPFFNKPPTEFCSFLFPSSFLPAFPVSFHPSLPPFSSFLAFLLPINWFSDATDAY